jgi:hypothetical protein
MGRVVVGMRTSVDGFVADREGDSSALYPDIGELRENEVVKQAISSTGAVILGRRSYDMADGDMTGYEFQVSASASSLCSSAEASGSSTGSDRIGSSWSGSG